MENCPRILMRRRRRHFICKSHDKFPPRGEKEEKKDIRPSSRMSKARGERKKENSFLSGNFYSFSPFNHSYGLSLTSSFAGPSCLKQLSLIPFKRPIPFIHSGEESVTQSIPWWWQRRIFIENLPIRGTWPRENRSD